jgi:hypothetical protein
MSFTLDGINYWAVLVAGVGSFLLGGVWYSALFGQKWVKLQGYSEEKAKEMKAQMSPVKFFGGMLLCYIVLALAVAILVVSFNLNTVLSGLMLGSVLWIGPAGALAMTAHIATQKPFTLYAIDAGFYGVALLFTTGLLTIWR